MIHAPKGEVDPMQSRMTRRLRFPPKEAFVRHSRVLALIFVVAGLLLIPGQAAAIHIACGQTVSGANVTLDDDLNCTGNGLIVSGRNTFLSLNGHSITGDGNETGIIVTGNGVQVVSGGPVEGFGSGIVLNGVRGVTVSSLEVNNNGTGIGLVAANANLITNNALSGNLVNGIQLASDSNRNELSQNTITGTTSASSTAFGIRIDGASDANKVLDNDVSGTGSSNSFVNFGILVAAGSKRTLLELNDSSSNTGDGILVGEPATTLTSNTANNNTRNGINAISGVRDGGGNTATGNGSTNCTPTLSCGP